MTVTRHSIVYIIHMYTSATYFKWYTLGVRALHCRGHYRGSLVLLLSQLKTKLSLVSTKSHVQDRKLYCGLLEYNTNQCQPSSSSSSSSTTTSSSSSTSPSSSLPPPPPPTPLPPPPPGHFSSSHINHRSTIDYCISGNFIGFNFLFSVSVMKFKIHEHFNHENKIMRISRKMSQENHQLYSYQNVGCVSPGMWVIKRPCRRL